ncbi:MAG: phosphate/phosphite/phosphonate ABC transporter substrate-binding protein, partial [Pseudomonadota bacterium]
MPRFSAVAATVAAVVASGALGSAVAFELGPRFQDTDGDLVADTPSARSDQIDPDTLIFAYTP